MNWKIIISLASLNVLVTSLPNDPIQDQVEELYDGEFVSLLNSMKTLDKTNVDITNHDVQQLSEDCSADEKCLVIKKVSLTKYHQKMQEIQCVNGLIVREIWDKMDKKLYSYLRNKNMFGGCPLTKKTLRNMTNKYMHYMSRMLSMLQTAKVAPYPWQVEMFTYLVGLDSQDTGFKEYALNFRLSIEKNVNRFLDQCGQNNYLKEKYPISRNVNDINAYIKHLYENPSFEYAYRVSNHYTASNLMLVNFYNRHTFIYDWSTLAISLNMTAVRTRLTDLVATYNPLIINHEWALKPTKSYMYHSLIVNCIQLRLLYHVYVHIHIYQTIHSQLFNIAVTPKVKKDQLLKSWSILVDPLKKALRAFRIQCNMFWCLVRCMMDNTNGMIIDKLTIWERIMRKKMSIRLAEVTLMSEKEADEKLKILPVSEDFDTNLDSIKANAVMLDKYTNQILEVLKPADGVFIQLFMLADKNTFHSR